MASGDGTTERPTRVILMLVVIALHALFLLAIQHLRMQQRDAIDDGSLVLVDVVRPRPPTPDPKQSPVEPVRTSRRPRSAASEASRVAESAPPVASSSTPPGIDWRGNAARSAERVLASGAGEQYRSFGPKTEGEREVPSIPNIFRDEPKHELGEVGEDAAGDPIVWMSDNCYTTLDKRVQTARDWVKDTPGRFAPAEIMCLFPPIGRREADGTLFEHIKKREEPPVPEVGTEAKPLPARIQEGGVFER